MAILHLRLARVLLVASTGLATAAAGAAELDNLQGFESMFGRYAPGGDCAREPRLVVDATGIAVQLQGVTDKTTRIEHALTYAGPDYHGISAWLFPFTNANGYPVIMTFNADEQPGVIKVEPHDEGWAGGPKLSVRHQALVAGSPYRKCR